MSGNTKIITKNGIDKIENLVGKNIDIWNGEKWSTVSPYKTGDNDDLYRVLFSDGSYLDATSNHKFLVKNRFQRDFHEVETIDLQELINKSKYKIIIPRSNIKYTDGCDLKYAYDYGFILGDGTIRKLYAEAPIYVDEKDLKFESNVSYKKYEKTYGNTVKVVKFDVDIDFARNIKESYGLPKELFSLNKESILRFIAGWIDADGSYASNGVRLYGKEDKIRDAQLLLTKCGINSSVNLMSKKGVKTNLCERKNDVWYLQITKTFEIPCKRLNLKNNTDCKFKGKNQIVVSVTKLEGKHKSFCLTENELHQCVFNNVLTKQCNLTEIPIHDIKDQKDFLERCYAASFIGTLQAGYTDFYYLRDKWRENTEEDALLGVSLTGIASKTYESLNLKEGAECVVNTNKLISEKIGINSAIRTTCIKPSGTSSLVVGSSSGINAYYAPYYIRRIRVNKNEEVYGYLKSKLPQLLEDDWMHPKETSVISIPVKSPEGAIYRDETPIDLLERIKHIYQEWVLPGHIKGSNTHNISATISIKDDEWDIVRDWMWKNKDYYNGLSILPYNGGNFKQAPFEECTKETYDNLMQYVSQIDLDEVVELSDNVDLQSEGGCSGGACEVK